MYDRFNCMKLFVRRLIWWHLCLALPLLSSCSEQEGQIAALKDSIASARDTNTAATEELQKLSNRLSELNRKISAQASKRLEFETKSQKSGAAEQLLIKYRTELEESLKQFSESVAAYRKQYLTP